MTKRFQASILIGSLVFSSLSFAQAPLVPECEHSPDGIMQSYQAVLNQQAPDRNLYCLLDIYKNASGIMKVLAGGALRPLMGGKALAGRKLDGPTRKAVEKFQMDAEAASDLLHDSFLAYYAQGQWSTYDLFCQGKSQEFCTLFLPDEKQVQKESPLMGSSSMILLRSAYLTLKGPDQKFVEERLRSLHKRISNRDPLKRKVIEQIYQELFSPQKPLSSLS